MTLVGLLRSQLATQLLLVFALALEAVGDNRADSKVSEGEITKCVTDNDCIVVPYRHCCGASKRAINRKFQRLYQKTAGWQKFNDLSVCAVIGVCRDDSAVKAARCSEGQCELQF